MRRFKKNTAVYLPPDMKPLVHKINFTHASNVLSSVKDVFVHIARTRLAKKTTRNRVTTNKYAASQESVGVPPKMIEKQMHRIYIEPVRPFKCRVPPSVVSSISTGWLLWWLFDGVSAVDSSCWTRCRSRLETKAKLLVGYTLPRWCYSQGNLRHTERSLE